MNEMSPILKQFARFGIPGLALFVFLALLYKFNFSFSSIPPVWAAAIAIVFLVLVTAVTLFALSISRERKQASAFHDYEMFRTGCGSPTANLAAIERIARSKDPRREEYLQKLAAEPWLAWVEKHAIHEALDAVRSGREVRELYETVKGKEWAKIDKMFVEVTAPEALPLVPVFKQLKYWRYVNRRDHPMFQDVEHALAYGLVGKLSLDELTSTVSRLVTNA